MVTKSLSINTTMTFKNMFYIICVTDYEMYVTFIQFNILDVTLNKTDHSID